MAEGQKKSGTFASCLRAHLLAEPNALPEVKFDDLRMFVQDKAGRASYVAELEATGFQVRQDASLLTT